MTNQELQRMVEQISVDDFNRPFRHKATFNNRLRTTGGRYLMASHHLEFNPKQLEHHGLDEFVKIIKHELCHYHLHLEGKGYKHKDREFKELLAHVGGSRFCKNVPGTNNRSRTLHSYKCKDCGLVYKRKRRINTSRFVCGKCRGKLKKLNTVVSVDDKQSV